MVAAAAAALRAGECRYVLGVRAMANFMPAAGDAAAPTMHAYGNEQFTLPYGFHIAGARFATRLHRYMAEHGATREDLYETVALFRRNARLNPFAIWRDKDLTREQYLAAPMIASPHCLFDCDMPVFGAAAFVMARADDVPAAATPAWVSGWAGQYRPQDVFERSGLAPADVSACQLYDGFTSMTYEWLEGFGFVAPGQAWRFIRDGHAAPDGRLPLNTFGGSLGEGRLHGIGHLREAYLQVAGKAGPRQLKQADHCLVQIGPYDLSSFVMLSAEPRPVANP
ncbi:MAG: thiolase family protein [Burkholderiaceae bacterium]